MTAGQSVRTNQAKSTESTSKPGSGSNLRSVSSHRSAKTKHDKPRDHDSTGTRAVRGSSVSGVLTSAKTNCMFSRATSAPKGLLKIQDAVLMAGSASFCTHDDEGLSALETLETLKFIVSSGAESNFQVYQVPQALAVGPYSVMMNNNQERAENAFVVGQINGKKAQARELSRHRSWPMSNAADNVVISQDPIHRSSTTRTISSRTSSSESRGTRQMVAFCETERLQARSLIAKAHSSTQTNRPANSLIIWAFHTWLVLYILLVVFWTFFTFFYGL